MERASSLKVEYYPQSKRAGGEPTGYAYQWLRCEGSGRSQIEGATKLTYELGAEDGGHTIEVRETAENTGGWNAANSEATAIVSSDGQFRNVPPPEVTGVEVPRAP